MVEYSSENRFPFRSKERKFSMDVDDYEDLFEFKEIFSLVVEKYPSLSASAFYEKVNTIDRFPPENRVGMVKNISDSLISNVKTMFEDENFIHRLHDQYGFGVDQVIKTLYAVYGYYFYTGKRTANMIKKVLDGYKRKPVH